MVWVLRCMGSPWWLSQNGVFPVFPVNIDIFFGRFLVLCKFVGDVKVANWIKEGGGSTGNGGVEGLWECDYDI